jgi:hypothetical protein
LKKFRFIAQRQKSFPQLALRGKIRLNNPIHNILKKCPSILESFVLKPGNLLALATARL